MKYTPKPIPENVNISKTSAIREFLVLILGIGGVLVGLYVALGLALNFVVPRLSPELEDHLGGLFAGYYADEQLSSPTGKHLQEILDRLVAEGAHTERTYRVHVVPNPVINAMALPGGHIVVYTGLLDKMESENELAMVLGHELGHFKNRDHLRGLGRALVLTALSAATLGIDSQVSKILQSLLINTEMKFSQKQELLSDAWGLELLTGVYGHAGGATDFFKRMGQEDKVGPIAYFFATHPYPKRRVQSLEIMIEEKGYPILETVPLAFPDDE